MLKKIIKLANKLDSLGLTKEADVLDRYIEKNAVLFHNITPPPEWAQNAFKKWLTTTSVYNRTYSFSNGGEVASFIPTSSVDAARTAYGEIIGMSAFVRKELARDPNAYDLNGWYIDNIMHSSVGSKTPYLLSEDFNELASKLEDVASDTPNLPELQRLYREAAAHLRETATLWEARRKNVRNASLFEGAFDTIKELFGKGKSREEEAAEHFTTINPIWPKMQAKLERDRRVRITVQKNLGLLTGEDPNDAYDKYIPSEWQNSREYIMTYRKAMRKILGDYISTLNSTEKTDKEKKIKEYEEMQEEQEVAKRWVTDRGIVDNVMGRLGIQSELRDMVRKICFEVYLRYFKIGNKNPYSIDIINDVIFIIEDASFGEYSGPGRNKYNSKVLGRAISKAQSLNLSNLSKPDDTSTY